MVRRKKIADEVKLIVGGGVGIRKDELVIVPSPRPEDDKVGPDRSDYIVKNYGCQSERYGGKACRDKSGAALLCAVCWLKQAKGLPL